MKITKEKSDQILKRFKELRKTINKKSKIYKILSDEFEIGFTTAFDHSQGRLSNLPIGRVEDSYKTKNGLWNKEAQENIKHNLDLLQSKTVKKPRVLFVDLENSPNLGWCFGKYEQNIIDFEHEWYILSFCYKWCGEEDIYSVALPDFDRYKKDITDDYDVVKVLWDVFDEADVICGHNVDKFDIKKAYARFVYHELPPPSPFKTIDTLKIARRYFKFNSNKLDDLGEYLKLGRKVSHEGWGLWLKCMRGDSDAWEKMIEYNIGDVDLLEKVYCRFLPYIQNHPNLSVMSGNKMNCPNCNSSNMVKRGFSFTRVAKVQRWQCSDCSAWSAGEKVLR